MASALLNSIAVDNVLAMANSKQQATIAAWPAVAKEQASYAANRVIIVCKVRSRQWAVVSLLKKTPIYYAHSMA